MSRPDVRDWADVQGLVRSAYTHLPYANFVLFRIGDADWARLFVASLLPEVTPGNRKDSDRALNIAFSAEGLRVLCRLSRDELASFPSAFIEGMARARHQSGMPGQMGESAPDRWFWGGPHSPVHGLLALYHSEAHALVTWVNRLRSDRTSGLTWLSDVDTTDARAGREHALPLRVMNPGEFLLGYEDNTGAKAPVPSLSTDPDFGADGTFLVARQIAHHVDRSLEHERPGGSWTVTVREPADSRPVANGHGVLRRARVFGHRERPAAREPEPLANRFTEPGLMFFTLTAAVDREFELVRQNDVVRGGEYFFLPGLRSLERLVKTPAHR